MSDEPIIEGLSTSPLVKEACVLPSRAIHLLDSNVAEVAEVEVIQAEVSKTVFELQNVTEKSQYTDIRDFVNEVLYYSRKAKKLSKRIENITGKLNNIKGKLATPVSK
ncbi:hypothetical protein PCE1_004891 [Barthelona sp. PCE]